MFAPVSTIRSYNTARSSSPLQKLRQLRNICCDPARLVEPGVVMAFDAGRLFTGYSQAKPAILFLPAGGGWLWAMTTRFILALALACMIGPSLTHGSPACMTESEARAKFPRAHLIWVGTNHCWTFGAVSVHSRRPVLAAEPVPSPRPTIAAVPVPSPRPAIAAVPVPSARPEIAAAPSSRPEIDSGGIDITRAQCQYSPCE